MHAFSFIVVALCYPRMAAGKKKLSPQQHREHLAAAGLVSHALLLTKREVQGEWPQRVSALACADTSTQECGFGMTPLPDLTVKSTTASTAANSRLCYSFQPVTNLLAPHGLVLLTVASAVEHFN